MAYAQCNFYGHKAVYMLWLYIMVDGDTEREFGSQKTVFQRLICVEVTGYLGSTLTVSFGFMSS